MMALMDLQTASGHFKEDKLIFPKIVGKPLGDARPELMDAWLTALVIAFLELKCSDEKNLWQMSVEKARAVLPDAEFLQIAKNCVENI